MFRDKGPNKNIRCRLICDWCGVHPVAPLPYDLTNEVYISNTGGAEVGQFIIFLKNIKGVVGCLIRNPLYLLVPGTRLELVQRLSSEGF